MNVLVVPTNREQNIKEFLKVWNSSPTGDWDQIVIVEDNPEKTFDINIVDHYSWKEIEEEFGGNAWIISRRDSAIRSFGFWKACEMGADYIFTLDDDCYPLDLEDEDYFCNRHLQNILKTPKWTELIPLKRTRGLPYYNKGLLDNVVANVGLWCGVPDLDAIETLAKGQVIDYTPPTIDRVVPAGQYFPWCFIPGQMVTLCNGTTKAIELISPGDEVITDNNEIHKVLECLHRNINEEIVVIDVAGCEQIRATSNHNILTNNGWISAQNIKPGSYLAFPIANYNEMILPDEDMYAIGLFLAEGHYIKKKGIKYGICLSFHANEESTIASKFIAWIKNRFDKEAKCYKNGNSLSVEVYSKRIAEWIFPFCQEYSYNKIICSSLVRTCNISKLLVGLFDGDGHIGLNKSRPTCSYTTTSKHLANQVKYIINSLGYYCSISTSYSKNKKISYRISLYGENARLFITDILNKSVQFTRINQSKPRQYMVGDKYIYFKVQNVSKTLYDGPVYNLRIEDNHTYVLNCCIVKNCGMNFAFRKDISVLTYFPLMGDGSPYRRFDDIWFGVICKRILDHLGMKVTVGRPWVRHKKASDPMVNLVKEAPGVKMNEGFWELIEGLPISATTPAMCMEEVGKHLSNNKDDYFKRLGEAICCWVSMF